MVVISQAAALSSTRRWVESVVVGLALCPWASPVRNSIRYAYTDTTHADSLFETLVSEIELLEATPTTPTTILVHPHALTDFDEMNAFLAEADGYIEDSGRADVFQSSASTPTSSSAARPKTTRPTGRIARRTR